MKFTRLLFFLTAGLTGVTAHGQIFVVNYQSGRIGKYTTVGTLVQTNLITGLVASCIALDANWQLYVAGGSKMGLYTSAGAPLNTNLITGLNSPFGIALDGNGYVYVASYNNGTVGKYTTSGATVNASLIYNLSYPCGVALDGNGNLFLGEAGRGRVGKYTTSGTAVNTALITGVSPEGSIAVDGSGNLYVPNYYAGTIGKYSGSGSTINASLVTGLSYPSGVALDGNGHLFIGNDGGSGGPTGQGTIGEYTTNGVAVNPTLITGLTQPYCLIAVSMAVPEPAGNLLKAVKPSFSNMFIGINYQLQVSGDLNTWTNQGSMFTATNTSMIYPQYWDVDNWNKLFFRLQVTPQ